MDEKTCCCSQRKKDRPEEERKKLIHRLNGAYCPDILIQSAAVKAAVDAFNRELLDSHLRTCVVEDIRAGKDEVIDELLMTLHKLMR